MGKTPRKTPGKTPGKTPQGKTPRKSKENFIIVSKKNNEEELLNIIQEDEQTRISFGFSLLPQIKEKILSVLSVFKKPVPSPVPAPVQPINKHISILIIGHGGIFGAYPPLFCSGPSGVGPTVCVSYITPFGNSALLTANEDIGGIKLLASQAPKVNDQNSFFTSMDTLFSNAYVSQYNQHHTGEPIDPNRLRTVTSKICLNKTFTFEEPPGHSAKTVNDKNFGVYFMHNNIGIAPGTKFDPNDFSSYPHTTFEEIISMLNLDMNDSLYVIDTTCNPVIPPANYIEKGVSISRANRVNARYYQTIIDSIDGKLCSPDLLTVDTRALFNSVRRKGGSKTQKKKSSKTSK